MTTYTLPEVPRVTIERHRREVRLVREVRDYKTGKTRQIGFKMFNAAETLEIGYALLHVAEEYSKKTVSGWNTRSRFDGRAATNDGR